MRISAAEVPHELTRDRARPGGCADAAADVREIADAFAHLHRPRARSASSPATARSSAQSALMRSVRTSSSGAPQMRVVDREDPRGDRGVRRLDRAPRATRSLELDARPLARRPQARARADAARREAYGRTARHAPRRGAPTAVPAATLRPTRRVGSSKPGDARRGRPCGLLSGPDADVNRGPRAAARSSSRGCSCCRPCASRASRAPGLKPVASCTNRARMRVQTQAFPMAQRAATIALRLGRLVAITAGRSDATNRRAPRAHVARQRQHAVRRPPCQLDQHGQVDAREHSTPRLEQRGRD